MADVMKIKKIVPLIAREFSFCQYVCKLVFGVDILDLNLGVQINSVKQPIKSNSVDSGNRSHCRASSFDVILITASLSSKICSIAPN